MKEMNTKHKITAAAYDKHGRLLAIAQNSYTKSHPMQSYFANKVNMQDKIFLHAEVAAILRAKDKKIHALHVTRTTKAGTLRNAKPCLICMEAIKAYGVDKVFYSDYNGEIVQLDMEGCDV